MQITFGVFSLHFLRFSFVVIGSTMSSMVDRHPLMVQKRPHIVMRVSIASEVKCYLIKSAKLFLFLSSYMVLETFF